MGYRRKDIPEMINALLAARVLIKLELRTRICSAISALERWKDVSPYASVKVTGMISEALGSPLFFLEDWMGCGQLSRQEAREIRLKWIDKMVRDLKEYAK